MWKILRDRAQGTAHQRSGLPCQDSELAAVTNANGEEIVFLACADGAGSAIQSEKGSNLACLSIWHAIETDLNNGLCLTDASREVVANWLRKTRDSLDQEAACNSTVVREYACTLLCALVGANSAVFFQLGDGGIVICQEKEYRPVFWPQKGEYHNETNFLTDDDFENEFESSLLIAGIDEVALFTDGLQSLVLNYSNKAAHGSFFSNMFSALREKQMDDLTVPFRQFLDSERVNQRTDDDKTLILAARVKDNGPQIL